MRPPLLAAAAALAAVVFAVAACVIVGLWAYPNMMATVESLARQGLMETAPGRTDGSFGGWLRVAHPVLFMTLPFLTISAAHLVAAGSLCTRRLGKWTLPRRIAWLAGGGAIGWIAALVAFVPPDLTSWLVFSFSAALLLVASWTIVLPVLALAFRIARKSRCAD